jgi:glycosyltransferase involved in cell wall biosynthesis
MEDCKKKRVVYVTHYGGYLGANRSLYQLIVSLRDEYGIEPLVIAHSQGEFTQHLDEAHIQYFIQHIYGSWFIPTAKYTWLLRLKCIVGEFLNLCNAFKLSRSLRKHGVDFIHSNTSATNFGAYLSRFLGIKHVWHIREILDLHYHSRFFLGEKIQKWIFRNLADYYIPVSHFVSDYFSQFTDVKKHRIVYNGITIEEHSIDSIQNDETIRMCCVGCIYPGKQQHVILEIVNQLVQNGFNNFHLYIIGEPPSKSDEYYIHLIDFISNHHLEKYVTMAGYIADASSYIRNMHIGILVSKYEAFGRVTVEYMNNGLLPVVLDSGANKEIVEDGISGVVFRNQTELSSVLSDLLNNRDKLNLMRLAAQKRAKLFNVDYTIKGIYGVYQEV